MSTTSSSGSNCGDSGVSFGGLRLEFLSLSETLHAEVEREVRKDPANEHAESLWPRRGGYEWVSKGVRLCSSKYRWYRLLRSWMNNIYLFERGADPSMVAIERVSVVEAVCHGREGWKVIFSTCTRVCSQSFMFGCRWTSSRWGFCDF